MSTLSLDDLEKFSDNIYEAIVVIAKRARQINEEQKRQIEKIMGTEDMDSTDEEEDYGHSEQEQNYVKLPKPTRLALEEYLQGKIKYEYLEEDE